MTIPGNLAATYSIVACDPESGLMGGAVQSHFFSVGPAVLHATPAVGVVATQALVNRDAGPRILELLATGESAEGALARVLAADSAAQTRQIALCSARGSSAAHTGLRCIAEASHLRGPFFSVQANMMKNPGVPQAMADAFEQAAGSLEQRLLTALEAAEAAGGDLRGRQSAAILVLSTTAQPRILQERVLDLRVEDHREPLRELRRLVKVHQAYRAAEAGDEAAAAGRFEEAMDWYRRAHRDAPGNRELRFWASLALAAAGRIEEARRDQQELFAREPEWRMVAYRLPPVGLIALDAHGWDLLLAPEPGLLYHVTALPVDRSAPVNGDGDTGFLHCCFHHQLPGVLRRWFPEPTALLAVLEVDPGEINGEVRLENAPGEFEQFPHLYGSIPWSAVRRVLDATEFRAGIPPA
jgi:uncharacterized Ntn-hydrolase superfamily protein/uncharacterized protein (DUF952 family)